MYHYKGILTKEVFVEAEDEMTARKKIGDIAFMEGSEIHTIQTVGPKPKEWLVGTKVMYTCSKEFGPSEGTIGKIVRRREEDYGKDASEYQVFWVTPDNGSGVFWTTPDEVVLAHVV